MTSTNKSRRPPEKAQPRAAVLRIRGVQPEAEKQPVNTAAQADVRDLLTGTCQAVQLRLTESVNACYKCILDPVEETQWTSILADQAMRYGSAARNGDLV